MIPFYLTGFGDTNKILVLEATKDFFSFLNKMDSQREILKNVRAAEVILMGKIVEKYMKKSDLYTWPIFCRIPF